MPNLSKLLLSAALAGALLLGCGDDDPCDLADITSCGPGSLCKADTEGEPSCVPGCLLDTPSTCEDGQACEEVEAGEPRCFAKVVLRGKITDALEKTGVAAARVAARDEGGIVVGRVAVSGTDGSYELGLPARRKADGSPVSTIYTLRADASAYHSFPGGLRPALPIDLATAAPPQSGAPYVIDTAATSISLIPVESPEALATIHGRVEGAEPAGTLVVAGESSAVADSGGEFVVFNVAAGPITVRGYVARTQLAPVELTVAAGQKVEDVVLAAVADSKLAKITGKVSIVNAPGGVKTSVVLAVEETFIESLEIGQVPRGLRATGVAGDFVIEGVPDGNYVALASLDNDGLVRDPDPNIAGTQIVHFEVRGGAPTVASVAFKVTEALAVRSPGAALPEELEGAPTFVWADDSSEDGYALRVFDALGNVVWEKLDVASPNGGADLSVPYGGAPLEPGMVYQFRAESLKSGKPISRTEELRGVFFIK